MEKDNKVQRDKSPHHHKDSKKESDFVTHVCIKILPSSTQLDFSLRSFVFSFGFHEFSSINLFTRSDSVGFFRSW